MFVYMEHAKESTKKATSSNEFSNVTFIQDQYKKSIVFL